MIRRRRKRRQSDDCYDDLPSCPGSEDATTVTLWRIVLCSVEAIARDDDGSERVCRKKRSTRH
jgi:hypothetical protein